MKMVCLTGVADVQRHLDTSVGFLIGSGTHWTSIIQRDGVTWHLDSNVAPGQPVAGKAPNIRWLSNKAVFKVIEGDVHDEGDAESRRRMLERFAYDWGATHPDLH